MTVILSCATVLAPYIAIFCGAVILWADNLREGGWEILPETEDFGAELKNA